MCASRRHLQKEALRRWRQDLDRGRGEGVAGGVHRRPVAGVLHGNRQADPYWPTGRPDVLLLERRVTSN